MGLPRSRPAKTPLGALLKEARLGKGLTQLEMSQLVGVSLKALRQIEQGHEEDVTIGAAQRIANYFGKTLSFVDTVFLKESASLVLERSDLLANLRSWKKVVAADCGITRICLFGSYARGTAGPDSDVDIVIFSDKILSLKTLTTLEISASQVIGGKKVDLVVAKEMHPGVYAEAEKDFIDV